MEHEMPKLTNRDKAVFALGGVAFVGALAYLLWKGQPSTAQQAIPNYSPPPAVPPPTKVEPPPTIPPVQKTREQLNWDEYLAQRSIVAANMAVDEPKTKGEAAKASAKQTVTEQQTYTQGTTWKPGTDVTVAPTGTVTVTPGGTVVVTNPPKPSGGSMRFQGLSGINNSANRQGLRTRARMMTDLSGAD